MFFVASSSPSAARAFLCHHHHQYRTRRKQQNHHERKKFQRPREQLRRRAMMGNDDEKDDDFFAPLGTVKEENKKQRRERKFEEDPTMTKALVNLYFMITFLGVSVFSSSFLGILDDHNNGRKEISLARVVGALAGMFITNTSSKRVGQTRARKVAMKGLCPGCDEEVYTFFDNEEKGEGRGSIVEHECHCCGAQLVFESYRESNREGRIVLIANGRLNAND
ncbi:unnamed protein product [Bathycoccus prasinos]